MDAIPEYLKPMIGFAMWYLEGHNRPAKSSKRGKHAAHAETGNKLPSHAEIMERMRKRFGGPEIAESSYQLAMEFAMANMRLATLLSAQIDIKCDGKGGNKCVPLSPSAKLSSEVLLSQLAKLLASE